MAEPGRRPGPAPVAETQEEEDGDILSYDDETEEGLEAFAEALAGLPD